MLAACGGPEADALVTFRDSADVVIAENTSAAADAAPLWKTEHPAGLSIGVLDGDSALQFFRVTGAVRLGDGRIAVLNSGTAELRFFDAEGRHLGSVGGRGQGPGEFAQPAGLVRLAGDSLLVWDGRTQRLTIISPEGAFARAVQLDRPRLNPLLIGTFDAGRVVIGDVLFDVPAQGFAFSPAVLASYDTRGGYVDSLGAFPWMEIGQIGHPGAGRAGRRTFAPTASAAARGERLWVGTAQEAAIAMLDADGTLRRIIRWDAGDRTVRPEHTEHHLATRCERATPERCREYRALPVMDRFPAYETLVADASGNLWVKSYQRPGAGDPARWFVFDPDGRLIARAETPERLRVLDIGDDWLLGVMLDELDVETIALHVLVKGAERR